MYEVRAQECVVAHDAHPGYTSTLHALELPGEHVAVQHHRAHVASVLAERGELEREVVGIAFDGTGYGDDGTIWGGEVFAGSVQGGLTRVAHLRAAWLPGGDAAARFPVQAAAGFLAALSDTPDFCAPPFDFPPRYRAARELVDKGVRTFATTSAGRLFDTVAALCGFTRESTFEGQAAMWLEHLASRGAPVEPYPFPRLGDELDYVPLLAAVVADRAAGRDPRAIARAFHEGLVAALVAACEGYAARPVVVSGGVFQNRLLLERLGAVFGARLWSNANVPANDGGLCLGQAALAAAALPDGAR
jgi:hydrogenase maturation protein HypF